MSVRIRLTRMGRRNRPFYRVVIANSRSRRDGRFIEQIGTYDPIKQDNNFSVKEDRIFHWLRMGAQPSDTVKRLLSKEGIMLKWHLENSNLSEDKKKQELQKWEMEKASKKELVIKKKTAKEEKKEEAVKDEPAEEEEKKEEVKTEAPKEESVEKEKPAKEETTPEKAEKPVKEEEVVPGKEAPVKEEKTAPKKEEIKEKVGAVETKEEEAKKEKPENDNNISPEKETKDSATE